MNKRETKVLEKEIEEKYPLCNICGEHADWLVIFYMSRGQKQFATTRCQKHNHNPESKLNNKTPYDQRPLWYGSWCFSADEGMNSSLGTISRGRIRSTLHSDITLLPNLFEEKDE